LRLIDRSGGQAAGFGAFGVAAGGQHHGEKREQRRAGFRHSKFTHYKAYAIAVRRILR
jgi:hypothetical protein